MKLKNRKSLWLRTFIYLIIISLIMPIMPSPSHAESASPPKNVWGEAAPPFISPSKSEQPTEPTDKLPSPQPGQFTNVSSSPVELVNQRTETSKVFDNGDGTFTKIVYSVPVHFNEDGTWEEISTKLKENKNKKGLVSISTDQTKLKTNFEKKLKKGEYVTLQVQGHPLTFSLVNAIGESGEFQPSSVSATYENNTIWYKGVFPKIDLRNTAFNETVKEDLVLHEYTGYHQFVFEVKTELIPSLQNDGSVIFQDDENNIVYTMPAPFMSDSNINQESGEASISHNVVYELNTSSTKNTYQLTVNADSDWLKAPERVYPVYIDPPVATHILYNAYTSDRYPTTNYSGGNLWDPGLNAYTLKVGYYDSTTGTNEAYLKTPISGLENFVIDSAKLYINAAHSYSPTTPTGVWLDEVITDWHSGLVNWNTRPASNNIGFTYVAKGQEAVFDVTNTVRSWATGTKPNYGFKIHNAGYGQTYWKKFFAYEAGQLAPFIEINYSYPKPTRPRAIAYSNGSGSNSGYVDLSWDAAPGATNYYVLLFNGYDYEKISVGNVTNWSTKGKKIWPTADEISRGEYALFDDAEGTELALDPSSVYKNAYKALSPYGDYSSAHRYWFRIMAEYPDESPPNNTSPISDEVTPYIPLEQIKKPSGSAYTNITGNNGYVTVNWEPVPGATGYKVWIYNGKEYEPFDVGNVTTWTTQNQNIWPTESEIGQGRYLLHHDKLGTEVSLNPSNVYRNSGGVYGDYTNYWFRVTAYSSIGYPESNISAEYTPNFTTTSWLGMQQAWASIPVRAGQVTAFNGNFIMNESDFHLDGRGPSININRTYNSQDSDIGLFGKGWYSSLEENVKEQSNGNILLKEEDKANILFTKIGDNQYQSPNGIYLEIKKTDSGFEITDKEKTVTTFNLAGKIVSIKDAHKNTVEYKYEEFSGKLISITDASGRKFSFTYLGKFVSEIMGPDERRVTFEYDGDYLYSSTTPEEKKYLYAYESGKLSAIFDPKHTETTPYKTSFSYENNRLTKITDPNGKITSLTYNDGVQEVVVTDPKGIKDSYSYTVAGNPLKTVVDAEGLKLTTSYEYQANNLMKKTNPNDQGIRVSEAYTYDGKGNVTTVTDSLGKESFEYNSNNDITKATDAEDKSTTVTYNGSDVVSATTNDQHQVAMTSTVMQYDSKGNLVNGSQSLTMGTNLLRNAGFEEPVNAGNLNVFVYGDQGTVSQDSTTRAPGALGGNSSLKIVSKAIDTNLGYIAGSQDVFVEPNQTYTLSGWIKSENLRNAGAFFNITMFDENGNPIPSPYRDNRYSKIFGTMDWQERQLTIRTTNETRKIRFYLEVEHQDSSAAGGTVWFDSMQLEEGVVSSSFNPVLNSSFENNLENWTMYTGNGTMDAVSTDGYQSLKLTRPSIYEQNYVPLQKVILNQSKAEEVTITGMSKADGVKHSSESNELTSDYAIVTNVIYSDGTVGVFSAPFALGTHDWQRSAVTVPASKPIKELHIHPLIAGKVTGTVWYDAIRVINGNKLTRQEYDSDGNYITAVYDEENRKTSFTYDNYGNKLTETDPTNNKKTNEYNKDNQLTKTTLANLTSVGYQYDDNGNTTNKKITADGKTQSVSYLYDVDNKLIEFQDALQRNIYYTYDFNSNLIRTKMPNGHLLEWSHDHANRVTEEKRNGVKVYGYEYDANGNETKISDVLNGTSSVKTYDVGNRLTSNTDRGGSVTWSYYDKTFKLKEMKATHGTFINNTKYDYNPLNQNTTVHDGGQTYYFDYDEFGNVRTYSAGNGTGSSYHYDHTNKLNQLSIGTKLGEVILNEKYKYDANSNLTSINRLTNQGLQILSYEFDSINQLKKESLPDGTVREYNYDGFGNRTSVKVTKPTGIETTLSSDYNNGNQLTKFGAETLSYDANGNRIADGKYTYSWNEKDQLTSVSKKGEVTPFITFKYDHDGRRIEKNVNGQVTRYYYNGDSINVLYETDGNGVVQRSYVYSVDGIRLAMKASGQTFYYHYNRHGDVIAMTDGNGSMVASYEYDAWGNVTKREEQGMTVDNPFGYAGYMYDEELNMYYLMARYYHPEHGVFLSMDPDPGDADDPITQNGYTYASNNPVMMVDPDGHWVWLVVNAGFAAYDGYKAYKAGGDWKQVAWETGSNFIGIGKVKKITKIVKATGKIHGNSLFTSKPTDVYVVRERRTGEILRFGETTQGYKVRGQQHARRFSKLGIEVETTLLKGGISKREAKALETRYIRTYKKLFGQKPPYNKSYH